MNVVIVGGGLVGSTLAGKLSRDGYDVTLVEQDPTMVADLSEHLDVQVIVGNGAGAAVLRRAGIEEAELLVATTDSGEVNMVVGMLGTSLFHVPRVVVRLRDPELAEGFELISKDHRGDYVRVDPEAAAVDRVMALLEVPGAVDLVSFFEGRVLLVGFRMSPSADFVGLTLAHIRLMFPATAALVAAIHRGDDWIIPNGDEEIRAEDLVYFAVVRSELGNVLTLMDSTPEAQRKVMIAGAGRIGLALARRLEMGPGQVVVVEASRERAREAEAVLERALVICGPVTDRSLLDEEDIARVSTFVALTPDHEVNLVSSLLAKRLGAKRAFAMVDNPALANLIGEIGIDAVISPRSLAVGLMLQHIRRGRIRSAATLLEDKIEVIEAEALPGSRLTSATLAELGLPRGVLVAARARGDELLMPQGGDRIQAGDEVLILATSDRAKALDHFLSGS